MMPLYMATVPFLPRQSDEWRDQFATHLARIAVQGAGDPVSQGWLPTFVSGAAEADRARWASHTMHLLREAGSDASDVLWEKWIGRYWERRSHGVPKTLGAAEGGAMAGWVPAFRSHFSDAAGLWLSAPRGRLQSFVYTWLAEAEESGVDERMVAAVLAGYLESEEPPFYFCSKADEIRRGIGGALQQDEEVSRHLQEQFLRLGCVWAE
jgi:hypothetical protein